MRAPEKPRCDNPAAQTFRQARQPAQTPRSADPRPLFMQATPAVTRGSRTPPPNANTAAGAERLNVPGRAPSTKVISPPKPTGTRTRPLQVQPLTTCAGQPGEDKRTSQVLRSPEAKANAQQPARTLRTPSRPLASPSSAGGRLPLSSAALSPRWSSPAGKQETESADDVTVETALARRRRLFRDLFPGHEDVTLEYFLYMSVYIVAFTALLAAIAVAANAVFPHCDEPAGCFHLDIELRRSRLVDVDPCQDMFRHVCGRWSDMYPNQPDQFAVLDDRLRVAFIENFERAVPNSKRAADKTGAALISCMSVSKREVDHTGPIREALHRRGLTWPAQKIRSSRELFEILVALTLQDLLGVFFQLKPTPYLKAGDRFVFELKYSETMFRYVTDPVVMAACIRAYGPDIEDVEAMAETLISVEKDVRAIAKLHSHEPSLPQYYLFEDIDIMYDDIAHIGAEWWVNAINKNLPKDSAIDLETEFLLRDRYSLFLTENTMKAYRTQSLKLQNYITWKLIKYLSYAASRKMFFCQYPTGDAPWVHTFANAMDRCIRYVKGVLPYGLLKLQLANVLDDQIINYTTIIANQIRHQMEISYNFTWLDATSAKGIVQRLRSIHQIIGMASKLRTDAALNAYYSHVPEPNTKASFAEWLLQAQRAVAAHKKRFLHAPAEAAASITRDDWELTGISVSAFYIIVYHIVYLPGSIMMPPFLVHYGPNSYNYGAIGKVLGHELAHAFDPEYLDVNPSGEKQVFYTPQFKRKFKEQFDCLILQANKMTKSAIAGNNSISETFADNAGVEAAYLAYKALRESDRRTGVAYLTPDQAFFAGTCYIFCQAKESSSERSIYLPHTVRCNQPCINTQEFAGAYGCKEGSPMYPRHRCDIHDLQQFKPAETR